MRSGLRVALALTLLLLLIGWLACHSHKPAYNAPDRHRADQPVATVESPTDAFVWVAFSGGGTRAAAMAWRTLEVLRTIPFTYESSGIRRVSNLADEIDYISGISGGSFAAAAWPRFRDDPEEFRRRFIRQDVKRQLLLELLRPPWTLFRLISPEYDRINVAAEYYDREIFDGATFSDLPPRPKLRIHATDVTLGTRFTFAQDDFNQIQSDVSSYPLGYACAASSAFPVLLSPLTVINYGETKAVEDLLQSNRTYRRFVRNAREDPLADLRRAAREHYNEKSNRYIHLADGGIVDNQGLEAILEEFETGGVISQRLADSERPLRRLVLVNVNAGVGPMDTSAKSPRAPGVDAVILRTMVASMDILSAKRWMRIKDFSQQLYKPVVDANAGGPVVPALRRLEKPYTIEISFRNVRDAKLREECNDLPTSFALEESQLELIDRVVPELIAEDPDMLRLRESVENDL